MIGPDSWIRHFEWIEQVDSTSSYARRWLAEQGVGSRFRESASDQIEAFARENDSRPTDQLPALFVADRQTAGRGRASNQWWSPNGCLMATLVIDSESIPMDVTQWPKLAVMVCGVAAAEAVERIAAEQNVQLKWPNDLYVNNKKVGGILTESIPSSRIGYRPSWLIGIGINVDIVWRDAPTELREKATCLSIECGRTVSRESMLDALIASFQSWLEDWKSGRADWLGPWQTRSLLSHRFVEVRVPPDRSLCGLCEGIDENGHLLIRAQAELRSIQAGEILRWYDAD